jgi:hypothetical protein
MVSSFVFAPPVIVSMVPSAGNILGCCRGSCLGVEVVGFQFWLEGVLCGVGYVICGTGGGCYLLDCRRLRMIGCCIVIWLMSEVGFGYLGRLGLENAEGRMWNIAGDAEPIAWCGWLFGVLWRLCRILLHFLFGLKIDGTIFCAMVSFAAMVRSSASLVVLGGYLIKNPWVSFLWRPSEVFLPVLWWPATIRVDAVYELWVVVLVITIMRSWSFVWFCNFPLLLKFAKMLDL